MFRELFEVFGIVPDHIEILADLVDQADRWPPFFSVLKSREICGGNLQGGRHLLKRNAPRSPKLSNLRAEKVICNQTPL